MSQEYFKLNIIISNSDDLQEYSGSSTEDENAPLMPSAEDGSSNRGRKGKKDKQTKKETQDKYTNNKKNALRYLETTMRSVAHKLRIFHGIKVLTMSTFYQLVIYISQLFILI